MKEKPTYEELEKKVAELIRKAREKSVNENQYRSLVDSTDDSLYLVDDTCRYLFMNNNHTQRLNISKEKITGLYYRDFHSPEQTAEFEARIKTVYETGNSLHDEHQSFPEGGYFLRTFSPVKDAADPKIIIAVSVVSKDITQRRKAEEALQQSEEKYRQLIEYSSEAIFIIADEKISYANPRTEKMLGYPLAELWLMSFASLVIAEDRDMVQERQKAILRGDTSAGPYSFRMMNRETSTVWVEANSVSILWENVPATLNFMRDITGQKRTETRLRQAQKLESIGTLAGGIAHDFNNLLMGIQGHASLALLKLDKNNPSYDHIRTIENLVMSGANLTRQLLGFARGGKYEVKRVDLNALIEKTSQTIGRTKKEIRIYRQLEDALWLTDVDEGQIEQVLLNLFVNAWQAMPGGGDLYIQTSNVILDENRLMQYGAKSGRYIKISVTDTGVGMDEKTKERVFEPFFTTKEMGHGTGLGLASAYGIIKNHNGFIHVYSEKGKGSTFNIYLPVSAKKGEEDSYPESENMILTSPGAETILLVDDEDIILTAAGDMLKTLGYNVMTAQDGRTGIDLYRRQQAQIDLVILDLVMPGMGGGEIFDEIRKINPDAKVLLSSGYSLNGQASRILERGCDGFIQKPFTLRDFSRKLRKVLSGQSEQPLQDKAEQVPLPL